MNSISKMKSLNINMLSSMKNLIKNKNEIKSGEIIDVVKSPSINK